MIYIMSYICSLKSMVLRNSQKNLTHENHTLVIDLII